MVEVTFKARDVVAFHSPVAFEDRGERLGRRAFDPHHGIDPLANPRALFEIGRVHQVHAAGPGNLFVDGDDLAVQTYIGAPELQGQWADGTAFDQIDAGLTHMLWPITLPESGAAQFVEQHATANAAPCRAHQGIGDLIGGAARIPNIEFKVTTVPGLINILHQGLKGLRGVRVQGDLVAQQRGHAPVVFGQLGHRLELWGNLGFGQRVARIEQGGHPLVCRPGQIDPFLAISADGAFTDHEIGNQADQRHDRDDQNPGQGHAGRPPDPDDPQGKQDDHQRVQQQIQPVGVGNKGPNHDLLILPEPDGLHRGRGSFSITVSMKIERMLKGRYA